MTRIKSIWTEAQNRLIAEFMNYTNNFWYQNNELSYHDDWNELMPVVEKIFLMPSVKDFIIRAGQTMIITRWHRIIKSPERPENSMIKETWLAVIEFITMYNKTVKRL